MADSAYNPNTISKWLVALLAAWSVIFVVGIDSSEDPESLKEFGDSISVDAEFEHGPGASDLPVVAIRSVGFVPPSVQVVQRSPANHRTYVESHSLDVLTYAPKQSPPVTLS